VDLEAPIVYYIAIMDEFCYRILERHPFVEIHVILLLLLIKIKVNDANNFRKVDHTSFLGLNKAPRNASLITLTA
jgi:hypothetical protein